MWVRKCIRAGLLLCSLPLFASTSYYWRSTPVGQPQTAQLLTLICDRGVEGQPSTAPLISILRDDLGENSLASRRVTAIWLLGYVRPTLAQRTMAAIPFFYWTPSSGSSTVRAKDIQPLLDLSAPQHPAVMNVERQLVQWTAFDSFAVPLRATSRQYRTNELARERLHLEEAIGYLRQAPVGVETDRLTSTERDFVIASLEMRKNMLGGFVKSSRLSDLGREAESEHERVRLRNWELLRQCAEQMGLVFEPLTVNGSDQRYAILWYPARATYEPNGDDRSKVLKLLDIKNPYNDPRLSEWKGFTRTTVDETGKAITLIPLSVYSLDYPRQPLLMVDFRDKRNLQKKDIVQKSVNEITAGIVGLSHFTNWYYFVAADAFEFIQERRGRANNMSERLDSYSNFRAAIALDQDLDAALRLELQERTKFLSSNPLETSPQQQIAAAEKRYQQLVSQAAMKNSFLMQRLDNQRREELASAMSTQKRQGADIAFHAMSLGLYTHRVKQSDGYLADLSNYRTAEYNLNFLSKLAAAGTPPEAVYSTAQLKESVATLTGLMPVIHLSSMRVSAEQALTKIGGLSRDNALQADCNTALVSIRKLQVPTRPADVPGIVAEPSIAKLKE